MNEGDPIDKQGERKQVDKTRNEDRRRFFKVVRLLRLFVPPKDGRGVRVSITDMPDDLLGDCLKRKSNYLIRLNKAFVHHGGKLHSVTFMLLAHEWAHAVTWDDCSFDHDDNWGIAMARCWRVITGEINSGDLRNVTMD